MQAAHRDAAVAGASGTPGVGIGSTPMVVGNMGSPLQVNYSVLGHHVNLAARLCSTAAAGEVLLGERTFAIIQEAEKAGTLGIERPIAFERKGSMHAKGISTPVEIISVVERDPSTPRS
jgi:adenylate cyclase